MVKWILQKNEHWISALEDYYFKVNTKRESIFFLQEDRLFCTNLEVVIFQGSNPMFIFLENSFHHKLLSKFTDLYHGFWLMYVQVGDFRVSRDLSH